MDSSSKKGSSGHVSILGAWALAFGCAVGWGAFVMPGVAFLPKAGPLGTVIGVAIGGFVMSLVAWNYHVLINRFPGPGGAYRYAREAFGWDHGFLCSWFLVLSYVAIVWANATALAIVAHYVFGDVFRFGVHYSVAGFEVWAGEIALAGVSICVAGALNCRRALACKVQTVLSVLFAAGIFATLCTALFAHDGGLAAARPAFSPDGSSPLAQVLRIVAISPWLYVGFESIGHASGEFSFSAKKSFSIMVAALAIAAGAYAALAVLPALVPVEGTAGWVDYIGKLGEKTGDLSLPTFATAKRALGQSGVAIIAATMVGAVFTGLVGNLFAASRLVASMADDGIVPGWCAKRARDGSPYAAALAISAVSLVVPFLGRTAIGFIVDVSTIGAAITYAYVSASAWHFSGGSRIRAAAGIGGVVLSISVLALFILPNYASGAMMATESYLLLVIWCVAGFLFYRSVFRSDSAGRFGKSTVVWIAMLLIVAFMSLMWMRQTTGDIVRRTFADVSRINAEMFPCATDEVLDAWSSSIERERRLMGGSLVRGSLVQTALMAISLAILFNLYSILRRREREMEREKTKARSYFFSTVSHDIRTPLNAIVGFSEMLKTGFETEAERKQALDAIVTSGKTLLGLVNDVLDLSKLESGRMEIVPEPTDCVTQLSAVVDSFRVAAAKPGVELRYDASAMPLLMLDPQRLRQIAFNLVGNAVKFTDKGHVAVFATYEPVEGTRTGTFRLAVEDTGCGISPEDLKRIASAYVQLGSKNSRNGGTGLGLAICKQLAENAGGTLHAESRLGQGSTFTITIPGVSEAPLGSARQSPAVKPVQAPAPAPAPMPAPTAAPAPGAVPAPAGKLHILLVDDSKMNLVVMKAQLKKLGVLDVETADDGVEALKKIKNPDGRPFNLVLTDMWMPNLDGEGLVKAVRANPAFAGLRVVAVTADVELQDKSKAIGFDGLLLKPVTAAALAKLFGENSPS